MGVKVDGFAIPKPGYIFSFPRDHGAHEDYRIEWWYITANMTGDNGTEYGLQWTLFRNAPTSKSHKKNVSPNWQSKQFWMGHAAVTTPNHHYVAEVRARGGIGTAGVKAQPFEAWINDWSLKSTVGDDADQLSNLSVRATGREFLFDATLTANGPLVLQGEGGYSVKSAKGQASYYYSQPFYQLSGTLHLPDGPVQVSGKAWLDREWSSQPLSEDQNGWDWISLGFDDGSKLMGFSLRQSDGSRYTSATWIQPNGHPTPYKNGALMMKPLDETTVEGRKVPTKWQIILEDRNLNVKLEAINTNSWMKTSIPYWEGPIKMTGSHNGRGYLEMTGY